ncbi:NUDIX domain-containing protein [Agrobacterium rhizogenes]|nr:NUDIX domain-containing protein [Rhizobium rhizogenes]
MIDYTSIQVALVALIRDGNVLLGFRTNVAVNNEVWELPGGKLEVGETPEIAIRREVREELGIRLLDERKVIEVNMHGITHHIFSCYLWDGEIRNAEPNFCRELQWFDIKALPERSGFVSASLLSVLM